MIRSGVMSHLSEGAAAFKRIEAADPARAQELAVNLEFIKEHTISSYWIAWPSKLLDGDK